MTEKKKGCMFNYCTENLVIWYTLTSARALILTLLFSVF